MVHDCLWGGDKDHWVLLLLVFVTVLLCFCVQVTCGFGVFAVAHWDPRAEASCKTTAAYTYLLCSTAFTELPFTLTGDLVCWSCVV